MKPPDCSGDTVILLLSWAVDDDDLLLGLLVLRPSISNLLQSVSSVIIKCNGLLLKSATAFLFESATILLQSASIITKCDRTSWEFLEFGISRHPARRDQWRRYWLPTWLSRVFYHFDRKGIHYICHRRPIIHSYQLTQHHWKKNTFIGAASCKRPSKSENV